jgi:hypothetical protein
MNILFFSFSDLQPLLSHHTTARATRLAPRPRTACGREEPRAPHPPPLAAPATINPGPRPSPPPRSFKSAQSFQEMDRVDKD